MANNMYEDRPLVAILPKPLEIDDEIAIKGITKADAKEFSMNFTVDDCPVPDKIMFHFNVRFEEGVIVGNSKDQSGWHNEEIIDNDYIDPSVFRLFSDQKFSLIFTIKESEFIVYEEEDETRHLICKFEHRFPFDEITTFQVWGDVEKIKELTFRYH